MRLHEVAGLWCGTCFYWRPDANREHVGECLRLPPVVGPRGGEAPNRTAQFVRTSRVDVCGEWSTDQQPPDRFGLAEIADG